jgi:phytoene desaturase
MRQIIQYTLIFLGGAPQQTPALYSLMSHVDFNLGVWYPDGGIHSIIKALVRLGEQYGVQYLYNQSVTQIETKGGKVVAVHCGSEIFTADGYISNADYHHTEALLSEHTSRQFSERYWARRTLAPSAFILYLGVSGALPKLAPHNIFFSKDWTQHFRELTRTQVWSRQPSLYICNPNKTDPTVAPPGHENLFVLAPIAPGLFETEESRAEYSEFLLRYVERGLEIGIRDRLVVREMFSVSDFAGRYNSYRSSALGLAHTVMQSSIFRPPNRSRKVSNLYFVGANTTPGIGVPMCLISAQLVRDRVLERPR